MSLSNSNNSISYAPSTATTSFNFPYPYFASTDLNVKVEDSSGDITTLVNGTDFTVSATNGDVSLGATITTVSSYTSGDTVVIFREVEYTQEYDLQQGASIDPPALNTALDRIVAQTQQLDQKTTRTLTHPETDASTLTYEAPGATERANKVVGWDASGNIAALSLLETGTVTTDTTKGIDVTSNQIFGKVDDTSLEFDGSGNFSIKDSGVGTSQIADDAVTLAKIADAALSGSDATLVTGTAGTTDYTAKWNADGDLVDGYEVLDEDNMSSDSATKLATQQSIKAYVDTYGLKYSGATVFTGSMPTSFTDLDLSGTIGTNRCLVHLSVEPDATVDVFFRINGETKDVAQAAASEAGGTTVVNITSGNIGYITVLTDASGIVEWNSSSAGSGATVVKLLTYQRTQ